MKKSVLSHFDRCKISTAEQTLPLYRNQLKLLILFNCGRYFHGCRSSIHVVKNEKTLIGKVVSQASDLRASPSSVCLRKEIQFLNFTGKPFRSYDFTVSDSVNK